LKNFILNKIYRVAFTENLIIIKIVETENCCDVRDR